VSDSRRIVDGLAVVDHHLPVGTDRRPLGGHAGSDGWGHPVVVLVHGSLDRGASFSRVVRRLPELHVVTYDRRGYERSRREGPPLRTVHEHAHDLLTVIDGRPAAVVGHSYGGGVALAAALSSPASIRAVGAYEPPLPWAPWWPHRSRPHTEPGAFAEAFFRRMAGDAAWERLPERAREARRADGPALTAELGALREGGPAFDVKELAVPALFGRGERSLDRHRRAPAELAALAPHGELVEIDGAGHGAHLTHADAFAELVRTVVRRGFGSSAA
jgi:pimeloyl-ACP methyl ester carboxylesterase